MQSGKQKRAAIMLRREKRREQATLANIAPPVITRPTQGSVIVNCAALAANNSYGLPTFVERGYYLDLAFTCRDCGARQVWTADQQQWWYETANGYVYSTAIRCASCQQQRRLALSGNQNKKEQK